MQSPGRANKPLAKCDFGKRTRRGLRINILFSVSAVYVVEAVCVIADSKENITITTWKTSQGKTTKKKFREEFMFHENLYLLLQRNKESVNSDFQNMQDSS